MADLPLPMEQKRLMGIVAVLGFGLTALFSVLALEALVAPTFVLSFFLLLPLISILGDDLPVVVSEDGTADDVTTIDATDPVERLRSRYANGEMEEVEFERKLERLLETEDLEERVVDRERSLELE